jgi:DNA-binding response OmpR family regulator
VLTTESAQESLEIFTSEAIDAVVIHHFLGEIDGWVSAQMKHLRPDTPVIMLLSSRDEPIAALPVVDVFMSKLDSPNILLAKQAVLHSKHASVA